MGQNCAKIAINAISGQIRPPLHPFDALTVQRVPQTGSWRIAFVVTPRAKKPVVDLRCYLTLYGEVLTETWVYQWTP